MSEIHDQDFGSSGTYTIQTSNDGRRCDIVAMGSDQGTALAAVLTGFAAAIAERELPSPSAAAVVVPIRAEASDYAGLVPELTNALLETLDDEPALIGPVEIDGILRTDDGVAAWGYMLTTAEPVAHFREFAISNSAVDAEDGAIAIQLHLTRVLDTR